MEDSPCHQEMVALAAVGSPEERDRLRDFTNIMLEHDGGTQALLMMSRMMSLCVYD